MYGSRVEEMILGNQIDEVAPYCESEVLNNYPVWLMCELFRGSINTAEFGWSERQVGDYVTTRRPLTLTYLLRSAFQKALGCYSPCPARTESN